MKKLFLLSTVLLVSFIAQAQTLKVSPTLKKGSTHNYGYVVKSDLSGKVVNLTYDATYSVVDETPDGFVISCCMKDFKSDASDKDIVGRLITASNELMAGVDIEAITDKDGRVTGIRNFDKTKKLVSGKANQMVEEIVKNVPEVENMMSKDALMQQLMEAFSEETLIRSLQMPTSVLALNGKIITTGAQDEYITDQGLKMKRMYFVSGDRKITTTSTMSMSRDELKKIIIEKVEQMAPGQADMIKQNIDAVLDSNMLKIEMTEKASYELAADGWMKNIDVDSQSDSMGQKVNTVTKATLK